MSVAEGDLRDCVPRLAESRLGHLLTRVGNLAADQGIECYLVGGLVRDLLLDRQTADIDVAVGSDALEVAARVAAALGGKFVPLDRANRIGRVVLVESETGGQQRNIDFATFDGDIEQDLGRRDFTIDALAIDLSQLGKAAPIRLIDPGSGRHDLGLRLVRALNETVFISDAARLLRAVRLAGELGFAIDNGTESLIRRDAHLVSRVAGERVREELVRLLALPGAGKFLFYLDCLHLLTALFPELALTKGVVQPREHRWDVFEHSLKTVEAVEFLLRQGSWQHAGSEVLSGVPWSAVLAQHFAGEVSSGSTRGSLLKLAALLHDIAKPQTRTTEAGGRIRFLSHAREGATIAASILERLRFSAREVKLVETVIRHHLRPGQMSQDGAPTRRAIYRYFRDTGEAGMDILYLSLADHLATRGVELDPGHWRRHVEVVEYALSQYCQKETRPPKLVDGHDIINIFGLSPGPKIGEILEAVREAQAAGEITTREQGLAFVARWLGSPGKS